MEENRLFTLNEIYKIVEFVTDYNDKNINSEQIIEVYGVDVEHLNTQEAVDTFIDHIKRTDLIEPKELWGSDLYAVFCNHINEKGYLTDNWAAIIEKEVPKFDKNYNDNPVFTDTYSRMYNTDFEYDSTGTMIRPVETPQPPTT